ncbi:MAG: hypothetical protein IH598_13430 [Bacteroidales bacterium]|nr:hypothetical protein [Bacteroidales bacterium]
MKNLILLLALSATISVGLFSQTQLAFRFSNPQVISGMPEYFQFDVDVKASAEGTVHRDLQVYFDYNADAFGNQIVGAGKVNIEMLPLLSDHYHIVNVADNTPSKFAVITEAVEELNQNGSSGDFNAMPSSFTGLLRIQIEIANSGEACGISFDEELMNGGQYHQSLTSTDPLKYLDPSLYANTLGAFSFIGQDIALTKGWAGISSYMLPFDPSVESMFSAIDNELTILKNFFGVYQPSAGVNTLGNWDTNSGYMIKVENNCQVKVLGAINEARTLSLNDGWNLIPGMVNCEVATADLFGAILSSVIIIQDVAGVGVFWPAYNINTLPVLTPGKAYFVKLSQAGVITFPECN